MTYETVAVRFAVSAYRASFQRMKISASDPEMMLST
jgi:hypothetical protein